MVDSFAILFQDHFMLLCGSQGGLLYRIDNFFILVKDHVELLNEIYSVIPLNPPLSLLSPPLPHLNYLLQRRRHQILHHILLRLPLFRMLRYQLQHGVGDHLREHNLVVIGLLENLEGLDGQGYGESLLIGQICQQLNLSLGEVAPFLENFEQWVYQSFYRQ